ncbi:hypothetical protein [Streptomyces sp. NPDC001205]
MNKSLHENVAQFVGDARPASDDLVEQIARTVSERRDHDHPQWEDLYCTNLTEWAGERVGPVLRRLIDSEAEAERLRARLTELEADHAAH